MAKKRAELPTADEALIGRRAEPKPSKTLKPEKTKELKFQPSKDVKVKRIQISVHLTPETLKRIELAKAKLFSEQDIKVTRSDIIEAAVKRAVEDPKLLAKIFG